MKLKILVGATLLTGHPVLSFVVPRSRLRDAPRPILSAADCTWRPQDLTADNPGYAPIPDDDYIKQYQRNPELWPVEFFVIAYRRRRDDATQRDETQVLVRKSANGTSKYGVGTGVPITRWVPSSQTSPPQGYEFSDPPITFDARNYPEFPEGEESWAYTKIDIREDAFSRDDGGVMSDPELENYATKIRDELRLHLSERIKVRCLSPWELSTASIVKRVVDNPNSVAAIQGSFRMSGLFAKKEGAEKDDSHRCISLKDAPNPVELVQNMRIYTMFPQMPDPMPLPSTSAEDLHMEIETRSARMAEGGRNPHKDKYGRTFTHISTSNVSNTIHGVYFTVDVTGLPGLEDEVPPALDLFGTKKVQREWVSLSDLKVLCEDGKSIGTADTKPTFISGFIVRQLVRERVINL